MKVLLLLATCLSCVQGQGDSDMESHYERAKQMLEGPGMDPCTPPNFSTCLPVVADMYVQMGEPYGPFPPEQFWQGYSQWWLENKMEETQDFLENPRAPQTCTPPDFHFCLDHAIVAYKHYTGQDAPPSDSSYWTHYSQWWRGTEQARQAQQQLLELRQGAISDNWSPIQSVLNIYEALGPFPCQPEDTSCQAEAWNTWTDHDNGNVRHNAELKGFVVDVLQAGCEENGDCIPLDILAPWKLRQGKRKFERGHGLLDWCMEMQDEMQLAEDYVPCSEASDFDALLRVLKTAGAHGTDNVTDDVAACMYADSEMCEYEDHETCRLARDDGIEVLHDGKAPEVYEHLEYALNRAGELWPASSTGNPYPVKAFFFKYDPEHDGEGHFHARNIIHTNPHQHYRTEEQLAHDLSMMSAQSTGNANTHGGGGAVENTGVYYIHQSVFNMRENRDTYWPEVQEIDTMMGITMHEYFHIFARGEAGCNFNPKMMDEGMAGFIVEWFRMEFSDDYMKNNPALREQYDGLYSPGDNTRSAQWIYIHQMCQARVQAIEDPQNPRTTRSHTWGHGFAIYVAFKLGPETESCVAGPDCFIHLYRSIAGADSFEEGVWEAFGISEYDLWKGFEDYLRDSSLDDFISLVTEFVDYTPTPDYHGMFATECGDTDEV